MAGVVVAGTRLVYLAEKKEMTVQLNNAGEQPGLVQSWIDTGDVHSTPTSSKAPFLLTPPLARLDPGKSQSIRLMFTGSAIPQDRESVFWFNILEIPPKSTALANVNKVDMAFRTRIKLFYRPKGLAGNAIDAIGKVQWRLVSATGGQGYALQAFNPTAFYVSGIELTLVNGTQRIDGTPQMLAPGQTLQFDLPGLKASPTPASQVEFKALNDYGAEVIVTHPLGS